MTSVSYSGFIRVHGLNEGHIKPYTDTEFQLNKYQIKANEVNMALKIFQKNHLWLVDWLASYS